MADYIDQLAVSKLRNATHVGFNEDFSALLSKYGPGSMGVKALYDEHAARFAEEKAVFEVIRKSDLTVVIELKDHSCDDILRGIVTGVDFNLHHFDDAIRAAAQSLKNVFDHYGHINTRNYEDQTALTSDLIRELSTSVHFPQVTALGLAPG